MNILVVTYGLPAPPNSGARIRDFNLIKRLARHHSVQVLALLESADELRHAQTMLDFCQQVDGVVARRGTGANLLMALRGWWRGRPLATAPYYYPELASKLVELVRQRPIDLVQIEHSLMAPYRAALGMDFAGATVLSFHNIAEQQYRSMVAASHGWARWLAAVKARLMRNWEAGLAALFDHCVVVSQQDRQRLQRAGVASRRISVVENGVDTNALKPQPEQDAHAAELLFVGTMGYLPNRDAADYFCREILPLIRRKRPDCRLRLVGSGGQQHLSHLARDGVVEVIDRADDLPAQYRRARVVVVPLRSGGGSRLKIPEALALGRPVVSTALGAEGLPLQPGKDILLADRPEDFAREVLALIDDAAHWRRVAEQGRRAVEQHLDWDLAAGKLLDLYQRLGRQDRRDSGMDGRPGTSPAGSAAGQAGRGSMARPALSVIIPAYNASDSLGRCLDALEQSRFTDYELIVVDDGSSDASADIARSRCTHLLELEHNSGAAHARNEGCRLARAPIVFFLDADVLVEPDTLEQVMQVFADEHGISAMFCSYQHDTTPKNFTSQFKNLQHHFTHQISQREAATFCGGYGAMYRKVFTEMGGFDRNYRAMEDVELGYRLHNAGHRILLERGIQLTHTKRYTLPGLVRADVMQRAIPWTRVMLQRRVFRSDLNLRPNNLATIVVVLLMLLVPFLPLPAWPVELVLLLVFIALNWRFIAFLHRMRGAGFALRSVPMIWLQYLYGGIGGVLGVAAWIRQGLLGRLQAPAHERV